jgi:hypothetical protein
MQIILVASLGRPLVVPKRGQAFGAIKLALQLDDEAVASQA